MTQRTVPYVISEVRASGRSGEREHVADVVHAGKVHNQALKAQTETRVLYAAVLAELQVPPVVLLGEASSMP